MPAIIKGTNYYRTNADLENTTKKREYSQCYYKSKGYHYNGNAFEETVYFSDVEVAPLEELENWEYTLDDDNRIISLTNYIGESANITVYGAYKVGNKIYNTFMSRSTNTTSPF